MTATLQEASRLIDERQCIATRDPDRQRAGTDLDPDEAERLLAGLNITAQELLEDGDRSARGFLLSIVQSGRAVNAADLVSLYARGVMAGLLLAQLRDEDEAA